MLIDVIVENRQIEFDKKIQQHFPRIREEAKIIKNSGYSILGFTYYYGESTFIFESKEEASKCYFEFEIEQKIIQGWFYEKNAFMQYKKDYEREFLGDNIELPIEWID